MTLLQIYQPQLLQVLVVASPFRGMKGALAAPTQMTNKTVPNIPVHCTHRFAGVTYQQFKHLFQSKHEKEKKGQVLNT